MKTNFENGAEEEIAKGGLTTKLLEMAIEDRIGRLQRELSEENHKNAPSPFKVSRLAGGIAELTRLLDFVQDEIWSKVSDFLLSEVEVVN